jgi:hypothetical protein
MGTVVLPGSELSPPSLPKLRMSGAELLLPLYAFIDRDSTFYILYNVNRGMAFT